MQIKEKILVICTHNSARSQMAEGIIKHLYSDLFEVYSAGTNPTKVNPYAIEVMNEININISNHYSKSINIFKGRKIDYVITVCDKAKENCPYFPGAKKYIHKSFKDPSSIKGNKEEVLAGFREVRDKIFKWIKEELLDELNINKENKLWIYTEN